MTRVIPNPPTHPAPLPHAQDQGAVMLLIFAQYNSGRKATVRCIAGHEDVINISIDTDSARPYDSVIDGYLHLDMESTERWCSRPVFGEPGVLRYAPDQDKLALARAAIRRINTLYFARKLTVRSSSQAIIDVHIPARVSLRERLRELRGWTLLVDELFAIPTTSQLRQLRYAWRVLVGRRTRRVECVTSLSEAHLGGTWQTQYPDGEDWIAEAEQLKAAPIYLA